MGTTTPLASIGAASLADEAFNKHQLREYTRRRAAELNAHLCLRRQVRLWRQDLRPVVALDDRAGACNHIQAVELQLSADPWYSVCRLNRILTPQSRTTEQVRVASVGIKHATPHTTTNPSSTPHRSLHRKTWQNGKAAPPLMSACPCKGTRVLPLSFCCTQSQQFSACLYRTDYSSGTALWSRACRSNSHTRNTRHSPLQSLKISNVGQCKFGESAKVSW